jgi:hypothetical protein
LKPKTLKLKINYSRKKANQEFYDAVEKISKYRILPPPERQDNFIPSLKNITGYNVVSQNPYAWISVYFLAAYLNQKPETVIKRATTQNTRLAFSKEKNAVRLRKINGYLFINNCWQYTGEKVQDKFKYGW